ncbi:bifunctional DNA primase/polymerase [Streptomyces sp. NPDC002248]
MTASLLAAALACAERGWPVFPLRPGSKRPALHGEARCPRTGPCESGHLGWEQRATTDPDRIRRAWASGDYNVGLATGPANLVVVDLDVPKPGAEGPGGAARLRALAERHRQPVPSTRTVRTPSGGTHLYFPAPLAARLHNTAGTLAPLVDTRAWGGYVVAPGSILPTGRYESVAPFALRPTPPWLRGLLLTPQKASAQARPAPVGRQGHASAYARAALDGETTNVRTAREGTRNATLLRAARALGRLIAAGDLTRPVVETALQEAGEAAGLPAAECAATIRSALNWSLTHNSAGRQAA